MGNKKLSINIRIRFKKILSILMISLFMLIIAIVGNGVKSSEISLEEQEEAIYISDSEGFIIISDRLMEILSGEESISNKEDIVINFPMGSEIIMRDDAYYLEAEDLRIRLHANYPLFTNDGAYIYLYNKGLTLVNDKLDSIAGETGSYISGGLLYNKEKERDSQEDMIILKLSDRLGFSLREISIELWDSFIDIPLHSLILWNNRSISYINIYDDNVQVNVINITDPTSMINYCDQRISYTSFLNSLEGRENKTVRAEKSQIKDEIYQYYMSNKYIYSGDKMFHWIGDGYFMETDEGRYIVSDSPLYMTKGSRIILPADYLMVQPRLYLMNRASALSEITRDEHAVYIETADNQTSHTELFLFNGSNTYIFFDYSELYWSDNSVALTPLSFVIVDGDGTIGIYNYENDEYLIYEAHGYQDVYVKLESGIRVNLSRDILYRPDGQEIILFKLPSLLDEAK